MEIVYADNSENKRKWQDYVSANPDASLYHLLEWKSIMEDCFGHKTYYLLATEGGEVKGLLPIVFIKSRIFGSIFCSMPFLNFGGVLAEDRSVQDSILQEVQRLMAELNVDYLELRQQKKNEVPLETKDDKISMTVTLQSDPDILWKKFSSKHRNEIRRGQRNNLEIRRGKEDLLEDFYTIISRGWRDHGTPVYAPGFFKQITRDLTDFIEIYMVYHEGKPVAAAFNGIYNGTVEGMWTYTLPKFRHKYVNYSLYWEMIKDACLSGHHTFHLGRSTKDTGGSYYKKKWNAEPKQLFWQYILNRIDHLPDLNVESKKYSLYINTWRRLPLTFANFLGPHLAKNIP